MLWNECGAADSERIEQVWFAGMHSDVGGGYPDNDLASVSLCWMIGKVRFEEKRGEGLRFDPEQLREIEQRAQPTGKMHNSRRGLGVYYRYNPRNVWKLCHDADNRVEIDEPKIHHAVFKRIANNTAGYTPPGLPTSYRLVDAQGRISELNPPTFEAASGRERRAELLSRAQHHVFWRRVLYYGFVAVTLALLAMPYYRAPIPGAVPESTIEAALAKTLGLAPAVLPGFLGSWAGYWTASWAQSPYLFLALARRVRPSALAQSGDRREHPASERSRLVACQAAPRPQARRQPRRPLRADRANLAGLRPAAADPSRQHPLGHTDRGSPVRALCAGHDGLSRHPPSRGGRRRRLHDVVAGERSAELARCQPRG